MTMTGTIIKLLLVRDGVKQGEIGERLGLSPGAMNHIVTGRRRHLDATVFEGLQRVFSTPVGFWESVHTDEISDSLLPLDKYLARLETTNRERSANSAGTYSHDRLLEAFRYFDAIEAGEKVTAEKVPDFGISGFQENMLVGASYVFQLGKVILPDGNILHLNLDDELVLPENSKIVLVAFEQVNLAAGHLGRFAPTTGLQELFLPIAFEQVLLGSIRQYQPRVILRSGSEPTKLVGRQPILQATFEVVKSAT